MYSGMLTRKLSLIGVGNMGAAILHGLLKKRLAASSQIWIFDKEAVCQTAFADQHPVQQVVSAREAVKISEVILLAVKPQDLSSFAEETRGVWSSGKILISILAGATIKELTAASERSAAVVRAMPNLGAKVGESITVLTGGGGSDDALEIAELIFQGCGQTMRLEEKFFDLVTALSGSGPAYFFYLMELLTKEGVRHGLTPDQATKLIVHTAQGAARLAGEGLLKESPETLRKKVTSKGGTTAAALEVLSRAWPEAVGCAIEAAIQRGKDLSQLKLGGETQNSREG